MSALEDCCRRCAACERVWCNDNDVSPGEDQGICRDCFDVEDTRTVDELLVDELRDRLMGWGAA